MNKSNNILICPLEWGLGHATRMLPLARNLREMNNNIFIASGEEHLYLFRNELPGLTYIKFPGFKPGYSRFLPQYISLLLKTPLLLYHIIREHHKLKKIISDYRIDIVISDNRFGLWNRKIKTVYITHMPLIPMPKALRFLEIIGVLLHRIILRKYSFCYIPDLPGELNVSGRLSHGIYLPDNARYIGILSRFIPGNPSISENPVAQIDNTVILSGPEPQKGLLKKKLSDLFKDQFLHTVMLEGRPGIKPEIVKYGNITIYNHLQSHDMKNVLLASDRIVTRSGYTTIMELISLNCNALLIPTPGQTEQEYLADYLSEKGWFSSVKQNELKPGLKIPLKGFIRSDEIITQSSICLAKALKELLEEPQIES